MKKFWIFFAVVLAVVSCNKTRLCGCVMPVDYFSLSIRNSTNQDLLDPRVEGGLDKSVIRVSYRDGQNLRYAEVDVREPFTHDGGKRVDYYQLRAFEISDAGSSKAPDQFFIELNRTKPDTLTLNRLSGQRYENVRLNGIPLQKMSGVPGTNPEVYIVVK